MWKSYTRFLSLDRAVGPVQVKVTGNSPVNVGDILMLLCHYTGVVDASHILVHWELKKKSQSLLKRIWTYDGPNGIDSGVGGLSKISSMNDTSASKHSIHIHNVTEADSGSYSCHVENWYNGKQSDAVDSEYITIAYKGL